jgi:hypothetical protein
MNSSMERAPVMQQVRIVATSLCVTVCVLLALLWGRSYWRGDQVFCKVSSRWLYANSAKGAIELGIHPTTDWVGPEGVGWAWTSTTINDLHGHAGFALARYGAVVPHWFLALIAATGAGIPFIRAPLRFSLRTLLFAMALVAVGLGVIAAGN